jgi:broad specificity phosphatase PhoE
MQIIAIRHAITEFNEKELINGTIDEPLSQKGLQQLPELVDSLTDYMFNVVYTSPMKRSIQTAQPIAERYKVPIRTDKRLTEVDMGSFNGRSWDATIPHFGLNSSGVLSTCEYDFTPYGGENADQTRLRVQSFIDELKRTPKDKPLIVSHGGILRWFYLLCTGQKAGRIANLSVHTFEI